MNLSLYEIFFELEVGLCERFPSLSPFDIRRTRGHEVFLLMERLAGYNKRNKKGVHTTQVRRPAGDNWF